jgi:hypothetical protein
VLYNSIQVGKGGILIRRGGRTNFMKIEKKNYTVVFKGKKIKFPIFAFFEMRNRQKVLVRKLNPSPYTLNPSPIC